MREVKGLYLFLSNNRALFSDVYQDCLAICKYMTPFNNSVQSFEMIEKFFLESPRVWESVKNY